MTSPAIRWMDEPLYDELHGDRPDPGVGAGRLVALRPEGGEVVLPLRGTDVKAKVAVPFGGFLPMAGNPSKPRGTLR